MERKIYLQAGVSSIVIGIGWMVFFIVSSLYQYSRVSGTIMFVISASLFLSGIYYILVAGRKAGTNPTIESAARKYHWIGNILFCVTIILGFGQQLIIRSIGILWLLWNIFIVYIVLSWTLGLIKILIGITKPKNLLS